MNDKVTLLLVDDLEKNLVAMEALLRGPGLRVLMARSGDEALELLLVNEVALALVDVQMPGMDGFELAELMRGSERTKHVPIVFVTAGAHDRKRQFQGYDSGAVDFLYKPIEPHILTNKVAVFVALFRQKQALARMSVLQSAIFNSDNFSSIATDADGVIQIFNVGAERMLGYKAADVVDKITPADISDPQEVIARATALSVELGTPIAPGFEALAFKASRGIEDIYQLTYIRKDGSRLPAVVSVTALRDAQTAIIGYLLIGNDNTARKQMEDEQDKFNKRLCDQQFYTRSLIESNIDAIITTDLQGIITDVNHQMEVLTGCSRNDLIGAPFKSHFTDPDRAEAAIKRALREKKVANCELTVRARDGKETVVSYNAATLYDRDGIVLGVFAAARDVTEQKQASQYARSLIEAALDPLVTISAEGKITDVNEGSVKITGVARETLIGTDFSSYFTESEKAREGYKQVFDRGFVTDYPLTIRHTDGHLTDVLYNASVYRDTQGTVLGVFAAARDVTEQKQASQYARSLIEASLDPLVTISAEGKITDVNEGSVKITGVARETLIGTDFSDYFTEPEKAREGYKQVFDRGFVTDYPLTIRHTDGHLTDVLYNASVYRDTQGAVLGVFAAARDVTEQLRLAKDLKDTADELSRSNAELDQFASVASHDLQEPLRMISNYIELLERKYTSLFDDRAREYMGYVTSGAQRMAAMIKAILIYSQIGHQAASFTSFDSALPLQSALANLTNKIQEAEATITEGPLPRVNADANQLNQLLQNLLGNALKFRSDKRPLVIHVSAIESTTEFTFTVADNGIGMDQDGCGRIFQLFQRLNNAQEYPGTGIGLATCRKILEHHRGRIWVESKPDVGSTFHFTLPK